MRSAKYFSNYCSKRVSIRNVFSSHLSNRQISITSESLSVKTLFPDKNILNHNANSNKHNYFHIINRNFGISDTVTSYVSSSINNSKEKQFMKMIETMSDTPEWTLRMWKSTIEGQLSSWLQYIPGVSSSADMKLVKNFKAILDALTEKELDHIELINGPVRERVALQSSQSSEDVSRMLFFFKQTLIIHSWLQLKKKCGEELPQNEVELMRMQENDPRLRNIIKKVSSKDRKTGRGRGLAI